METKSFKLICIVAFAFTLIFTQSSLGQKLSTEEAEMVAQIDATFNKTFPADQPGGVVLVVKNGKTILRKGYGLSDYENKTPSAPENVYKIGSISKQFTAVAILMLEEQGKLKVSQSLDNFLPEFPNSNIITIEHLLTHTSGVKSYTDMLEWVKVMDQPFTVNQVINIFKNEPLEFQPGESFNYSNSGYILLGAVIEKASGMKYEDFVEKKILAKAGMKNSAYGRDHVQFKNAVKGYGINEDKVAPASPISMTQPYAAGSLIATVDDLYKWNLALFGNKIIGESSLLKATTTHTLKSGEPTGYGYGLVPNALFGVKTIGHGGAINGFRANAIYAVSENTFVAFCSNNEALDADFALEKSMAITLGKYQDLAPISLTEAELQKYVGVYKINEVDDRIIYLENGVLMSKRTGGAAFPLIPVEKDVFQYQNSFSKASFKLEGQKVVGMDFASSGGNSVFCPKSDKPLPEERKVISLSENHLKTLEGTYEIAPSFDIVIKVIDGKVQAQATGQPAFEIFPVADYKFFLKVVDAEIEFKKDENNQIESLVLFQGGQEVPGRKVTR